MRWCYRFVVQRLLCALVTGKPNFFIALEGCWHEDLCECRFYQLKKISQCLVGIICLSTRINDHRVENKSQVCFLPFEAFLMAPDLKAKLSLQRSCGVSILPFCEPSKWLSWTKASFLSPHAANGLTKRDKHPPSPPNTHTHTPHPLIALVSLKTAGFARCGGLPLR